MTLHSRNEIPRLVKPTANKPIRALELGVAAGDYTQELLNSGVFDSIYAVDRWTDHHGPLEYFSVAEKFRYVPQVQVIRSAQEEAIDYFPDHHFDMIYFDLYAHTGQGGIETLENWWQKLKPGGVFSGHDYCRSNWISTVIVVDTFLSDMEYNPPNITNVGTKAERFPSWWVYKL